jgi:hypothetical protein
MSEVLFLSAVLLLLIGAMGFYFYSRVAYTEKKVSLLESILLDIKMNMDMENQMHIPPPLKEPEPFEPEDSEVLKEDAAMYTSVIEEAVTATEPAASVVPTPDYELMSRDELSALAEKRSLRVTKSMKKGAIVNMLRESDKNTSTLSDTEKDGGVHATLSTEGSGGGAPLHMEDATEISAESLSA